MGPPLYLSQARAVLIFLQAPAACGGWSVRKKWLNGFVFFFLSFTKHDFKATITWKVFSVTKGWGTMLWGPETAKLLRVYCECVGRGNTPTAPFPGPLTFTHFGWGE